MNFLKDTFKSITYIKYRINILNYPLFQYIHKIFTLILKTNYKNLQLNM